MFYFSRRTRMECFRSLFKVYLVALNRFIAVMELSEQHDVLFCREILAVDLFKTKKKTIYRAELWTTIADNLNAYESPKFKVSTRAVRDRYGILASEHKRKIREEEKASGIQVEDTELDVLLEEIVEQENMAGEEYSEGKKKAEDDKIKAADTRRTAMESISETKKRKANEDTASTAPKSRKSVSKAIEFLREKSERQLILKEQEMELKKKELEVENSKNTAAMARHELMMQMMAKQQQQMMEQMHQQQQQQQQQANNLQAMIAQQNQMLMGLFDKVMKK